MEHKKFVELWNSDMSVKEIAIQLEVSPNWVTRYARAHRDECPTKYAKIDHEKFVELWNNGKTINEISEEMSLSVSSVSSYAYRHRDECPCRYGCTESNNETKSVDNEAMTYDTIVLDTSAISEVKTFEVIEHAKHVIISSIVLRELNKLKDRSPITSHLHQSIQKLLKECALDTKSKKYTIINASCKNKECPDEAIARSAISVKNAVVVTCDYGLCCFCKLHEVKYLLITKNCDTVNHKKYDITNRNTLTFTQISAEKLSQPHPFSVTKSNNKLIITCLMEGVEVIQNNNRKSLKLNETIELFEGDSVITKVRKTACYIVVKNKRNKLVLKFQ